LRRPGRRRKGNQITKNKNSKKAREKGEEKADRVAILLDEEGTVQGWDFTNVNGPLGVPVASFAAFVNRVIGRGEDPVKLSVPNMVTSSG